MRHALSCLWFAPFFIIACSSTDNSESTSPDASALSDASTDGTVDSPSDSSVQDTGAQLPDASTAKFRVSLSVSPFAEAFFAVKASFTDGSHTGDDMSSLQELFVAHGATEVYARIGTAKTKPANGGGVDSSLSKGLDRAKLAALKKLPLNPEIGLFRIYGDVSCQPQPDFSDWNISLPGKWETLSADQMAVAVESYGAKVAQELVNSGATINIWDLGNEVDLGTAGVAPQPLSGACEGEEGTGWYKAPDGVDPEIGKESVLSLYTKMTEAQRIVWLNSHLWPAEAKILAAAAKGIRSVVPNARFATHISNSTSPTFALAFYQAMQTGGFSPDVAGFSFYPSSDSGQTNRLSLLKASVESIKTNLGLPVFIAEYAYPAASMSAGPYANWNNALAHYPISETGQYELLRDLASWGASGALSGIRPWGPEVSAPGWDPMCLFKPATGTVFQARSSLNAIADGVAHPNAIALQE